MKQTAQERQVMVEKKIDIIALEDWSFSATTYRYEALLEHFRSLERDFHKLERGFADLRRKLRDAGLE